LSKFTSVDQGVYDYLLAHEPPEHAELRALRKYTQQMPRGRMLDFVTRLAPPRQCHATADGDKYTIDALIASNFGVHVSQRNRIRVAIRRVGDATTPQHVIERRAGIAAR
jgi:D-serine deaminase-like pyridoxal phosphate-dependent protein